MLSTLLALAGCNGAAQLVLKGPIEDRCTEAGLRGCEPLTAGVLEYVDGDREEATRKIKRGAAQNAPDQVREFAARLRALKSIPGADQYMHPVLEVADLLAPEESQAHAMPQQAKLHVKPVAAADDEPVATKDAGPPAVAPPVPREEPVAGTTVASVHPDAIPCTPFSGTQAEIGNIAGRCATVAIGPLTVTDVMTTGTCTNDLYVGAGTPAHPRWAVSDTAPLPLNVHGANLPVADGESLFVAQTASKASALRKDLKCTVTWAGMRR